VVVAKMRPVHTLGIGTFWRLDDFGLLMECYEKN